MVTLDCGSDRVVSVGGTSDPPYFNGECDMANLNGLIKMGADKGLVSAVMGRESRCVTGTVAGSPVRVILKFGMASHIMGSDAKVCQAVKAAIGNPRTEIRLVA
jgi:hypothetical protein